MTFEFVGRSGWRSWVAAPARPALGSARRRGILLLSDFGTADLDSLGVALALLAGGSGRPTSCWRRASGRAFEGASGLALGMVAGPL